MAAVEAMMCVVWVYALTVGYSDDGCDLALTLCRYDLRKGDIFVQSLERVQSF